MRRGHKDLAVWQDAMNLVGEVYRFTGTFPKSEDYGLTSQIRRAAVSIPANIAEGAARSTRREFLQFLHIARGSASELDTLLAVALTVGYSSEGDVAQASGHLDQVNRLLDGLIRSIKARAGA